jgi:hypothetical protein
MKKTCFILAVLLMALSLHAQKPVFKYGWATVPKTSPATLTMPATAEDRVAFLLRDENRVEYLLLDGALKIRSQFVHPQSTDKTIFFPEINYTILFMMPVVKREKQPKTAMYYYSIKLILIAKRLN